MDRQILESLKGTNENYIFPFLWMKGEEEAVIRREIAKIDECGIKAVCLESRPHPDFAGPGWWKDFDIVLDECKKRGMKIWILDDAHFPTGLANGLLPKKYPERAKQYLAVKSFDVTGPLSHGTLDIRSAMQKAFTWMDMGKPVERPLVDEQTLVSVVAMRMGDDDTVTADRAADDRDIANGAAPGSRVNRIVLTERVKDGKLITDFPQGVWRVFVVHTTYDEGARNDYINIIDRESVQVLIEAVYEPHYEHYREEFGKTIAGFFSDEPGFGNTFGFEMDESIGRKMMPLPWNRDVPGMLKDRLGENWTELLPLLWYPSEDEEITAIVRYSYMDTVSRLYAANFSEQLGKWCADRGVEYIGHVIEDKNVHSRLGCGSGHFFRAMSGQAMAGTDNIGGQVLPGNPNTTRHGFNTSDGPFYHYMESKMGASVALMQSEKKGRYMVETFGAYGWSFGVRDMKWVADWLIARGVNHLVPHAFSMDKYPDTDCPPHFYAGGHNPEFPYFARLMKYCNRLCHVFSEGKWIPEVGVLYHGEMEWMDDCMMDQEIGRRLSGGHIDYAIVPSDALADAAGCGSGRYAAKVQDGKLYINDVPLKMLIIPRGRFMDPQLSEFIADFPDVRMIFVEGKPEQAFRFESEGKPFRRTDGVIPEGGRVVSLEELVPVIREMGVIGARAEVKADVSFFHYEKEEGDLWMAFNESMTEAVHGNLLMKCGGDGKKVYRYDAMKNRIYPVEQMPARGFDEPRMLCTLDLEPYESAVFFTASEEEAAGCTEAKDPKELRAASREDLSKGWAAELAYSADEPQYKPIGEFLAGTGREAAAGEGSPRPLEKLPGAEEKAAAMSEGLIPISDMLPTFSGFMRYSRSITIPEAGKRYFIEAENLYEAGRVLVNGVETDFRLCPPYRFDLGEDLKEGRNEIVIETVNTPLRDVLNYDQGMFGYEKGVYEPSGLFGRISLIKME